MPATPPVLLTEKLLIAAGGWEAIKHAKALCEMGRVSGAKWAAPVLRGTVREGEIEYSAGLKIKSFSDVENLCACRASRQWGTICAHSLAVGWSLVGRPPAGTAAALAKAAPPAPVIPFVVDASATARLYIVLAPDLTGAWKKGQLLVGLELQAGGQRTLLAGQATAVRALLPQDLRVVEGLARASGGAPAGMSFLSRDQFVAFLPSLAGHPRVTLGKSSVLDVLDAPLRPPLVGRCGADGSLELAVQWPPDTEPLPAGAQTWALAGGRELRPVSPGLPGAYGGLLTEKSMRLPAAQAAAFLNTEWQGLAAFFALRLDGGKTTAAPAPIALLPAAPRFALDIEGSLNQLAGKLRAVYANGRTVNIGVTPDRDTFTFPAPDRPGVLYTRHPLAEEDALDRIKGWGFSDPDPTGHCQLRGEGAILRFFAQGLPGLQRDWNVAVGSRFENISKRIEVIAPEIAVRGAGADWFELEITLASQGGERFSALDIQRLLQTGQGSTRLRNGHIAVLPGEAMHDLQEVLRDCDPAQTRPGVYRLLKAQGDYLESTFEQWGASLAPSWAAWRGKQGALRKPAELALTPELETLMRPYQKDGVRWLSLLAINGLGGILADEMGLGKTLQALAYLGGAKTVAGAASPPSLVVCPTSLVDNWRRESARFTPELRTLAIDGADRAALFAQIDAADLVITSYALLRRDLEKYRVRRFGAVFLDEAHHIKNPDSQVAQAACALRSDHRFVLTGTPMENSVRDLWSIMHFALPGYLGSRQDFRERYEQPLSRPGDPAAESVRERLTRRLRPVLLRRRKKEVATELPDRIEQTSFCDLTPAQAEVYRRLLEQSRLKLDTARRDKNKGAGRMLVLTALLRLRQACCDLRLLGLDSEGNAMGSARGSRGSLGDPAQIRPAGSPPPDARESRALPDAESSAPANSAKLALLDELLEEIREGGHRVLIFSQFVSMLKILSAHLEAARTSFCYLDGSTKPRDRTAQVERFQTDETITAFLISVKAGGVGLNLTGADTVIHFDPWWNPAVEAQATDRAHRIGQTRVVTAYRLIARNTVEEKIFALQNRKKELTASLVEREKDEPLLETLSFEEIESLLE